MILAPPPLCPDGTPLPPPGGGYVAWVGDGGVQSWDPRPAGYSINMNIYIYIYTHILYGVPPASPPGPPLGTPLWGRPPPAWEGRPPSQSGAGGQFYLAAVWLEGGGAAGGAPGVTPDCRQFASLLV